MVYRTTPKMEKRKEARRRSFLKAARRAFAKHGYHATTVPIVVEKAGSSTGAFYSYFKNKEDLFVQLLLEIGERLARQLNEAIAACERPAAQMRAAVEAVFLFLAQNAADARILIIEAPSLGGRMAATEQQILASHVRSVERALRSADDNIPSLNPAVAAHCWVGAVHGAVRHWIELSPRERQSVHEVAADVARFNLMAVGLPDGDSKDHL